MKKLFAPFAIMVVLLLATAWNTSGQARLHIVQLDSFPQYPGDTAYEGITYHNIRVVVTNVGTANFFGEIKTFLYSQLIGMSGMDTLRDPPGPPPVYLLQPGDTISLGANPNYRFRSIHYAAGDNIIVVWPYSGSTQFDTYQTQIYYAMITGVKELDETSISIFPNPVSQVLHLDYAPEITVKQVRIFDPAGKLIFNKNEATRSVSLSGWDPGVYVLEMTQKDGRRLVKKIIINGN